MNKDPTKRQNIYIDVVKQFFTGPPNFVNLLGSNVDTRNSAMRFYWKKLDDKKRGIVMI